MSLEIRSILGRGVLKDERVTFRCVNADTDIGHYVLLRTGSRDGVVNTGVKNAMWFPDKIVQKGDLVVVYTRAGNQSEKALNTGKKAHFFYWGLSAPIWSKDEAGVVLLNAPEWDARLAQDL